MESISSKIDGLVTELKSQIDTDKLVEGDRDQKRILTAITRLKRAIKTVKLIEKAAAK